MCWESFDGHIFSLAKICNSLTIIFFASQQDEMIIAKTFGQTDAIDVTASSVEFDLSALIGRMVGSQRCQTMYSRCTTHPNKIMNEIRKAVLKKD